MLGLDILPVCLTTNASIFRLFSLFWIHVLASIALLKRLRSSKPALALSGIAGSPIIATLTFWRGSKGCWNAACFCAYSRTTSCCSFLGMSGILVKDKSSSVIRTIDDPDESMPFSANTTARYCALTSSEFGIRANTRAETPIGSSSLVFSQPNLGCAGSPPIRSAFPETIP